METEIKVYYPTEDFAETLSVVVESGETLTEAIQERGNAQFEFVLFSDM